MDPQEAKRNRQAPHIFFADSICLPMDAHRLKSFARKAFTPKIISRMRPRIQQITEKLIANIYEDKKEFDFIDDFCTSAF